jgi:DNA-binding NtrC family response regulator
MSGKVLLVMPLQRSRKLGAYLQENGLEVFRASDADEAIKALTGMADFDVVFVDSELPNGTWRELLLFVRLSGKLCQTVVGSRCGAEQLWADALQAGAYDVAAEPYEQQETLRIIANALDDTPMSLTHWTAEMRRPAAAK